MSQAEEKSLDHDIDPQGKFAINVNADFCHEINAGDEEKKATMRKRDRVKAKLAGLMKRDKTDAEKNEEETDEKQAVEAKDPFRLADVRLQIPRGAYTVSHRPCQRLICQAVSFASSDALARASQR